MLPGLDYDLLATATIDRASFQKCINAGNWYKHWQ